MKAIIPVAGIGTRLRPHTHTNPKVLLPVAGKPILGHILDEMANLGVEEITLIVGYRGDQVRDYVKSAYPAFRANFVDQEEMLGLGHAIWLARKAHGDEPALIILGDTVFKADLGAAIAGPSSALGVKEVEDPRRFGVVELGQGGRISRLWEKPQDPPSNLAIVGIYWIKNAPLLFKSLDHIILNKLAGAKGEYQLTDALQMMIEAGEPMITFPVDGWHDCGKRETLLDTNRALLDLGAGTTPDKSRFPDSVFLPPVSIAEDARVERSIVGPHVSVSTGAAVVGSVISDSILGPNSQVENCVLRESVISDHARVCGAARVLNVGDSSEIDFA
jgi:glucose-1-phosphate thymidylyltransferase